MTVMDLRTDTDEIYAARAQQGDKESFGVLVDRYQEKLLRYGRKFLSAHEDIEDIVQEIFVNAYQNLKSFDATQRFSPWIYRIAHNAFVDTLRKKTRSPFVSMDFDTLVSHAVIDESAERERNRKEIKSMINQGLDRLPPKYREIIIFYYLEELSYKEIADILRVPMGTVSVRIKRAKAELRSVLQTMNMSHDV
jgi:RNA polymerase sigma-70 factor (ECF subfamily)